MNVSSVASMGMPYVSVYGGAKAYVEALSRALVGEAWAEGVEVEVLGVVVGAVTGVSHRKGGVSLMVPGTETMAEAALGRVGCGRGVVVGYWGHGVQVAGMKVLPEWVQKRLLLGAMREQREREMEKIRKLA